ncbi:MAG: lamin tail domain-containing protein [bacterium]
MRPRFLFHAGLALTILGTILGWCFYLLPAKAANNTPEIVINELMWMGSHLSSADEWLELKNTTTEDVDVSGWEIWRLTSSGEQEMITFPTNTIIEAESHFVVANYNNNHANSALLEEPDFVDTGVSLSNSELHISLFNEVGDLIDEAGNGDNPLSGEYESGDFWASMERNETITNGTEESAWHTSILSEGFKEADVEFGTPGIENSRGNTLPEAVIEVNYTPGPAPLEVRFIGSNSEDPDGDTLSYLWDFGDGTTSEETDPLHIYKNKGNYAVTLYVADPWGEVSTETEIEVLNAKPNIYRFWHDDVILVPRTKPFLFHAKVRDTDSQDDLENVTVTLLNTTIELYDDGIAPDEIAGDEHFVGSFDSADINRTGEHEVLFRSEDSDGDYGIQNSSITIVPLAHNGVIISELLPDPEGSDTEGEYLEIHNQTTENRNLLQFKIEDASGKTFILPEIILAPNEYKTFYYNDSKITLNNSAETIKLFSPEADLLQTISYNNAESGQSYSLFESAWEWTNILTPNTDNKKETLNKNEETNEDDTTQSFANNLEITEFLPNPEGDDTQNEWIEIYNPTSTNINLAGFFIDDKDGGSRAYEVEEEQIIESGSYKIISRSESKIALNNDGDSVRLLSTKEELIEEISYEEKAEENVSFAKFTDGWKWTSSFTPGAANVWQENGKSGVDMSKNGENKVSIAEAKKQNKNSAVLVTGTVILEPQTYSDNYLYIQDASNGIKITCYQEKFPELKLGNEVLVTGRLSERDGEKHIIISGQDNIEIIQDKKLVTAKISDLSANYDGQLVMTSGQADKKTSVGFVLLIKEKSININLPTGLDFEKPTKEEEVAVTGVQVRNKSGVKILSRTESDIIKNQIANPANKNILASAINLVPQNKNQLYLAAGLLLLIVGAYWWWREKKIGNL